MQKEQKRNALEENERARGQPRGNTCDEKNRSIIGRVSRYSVFYRFADCHFVATKKKKTRRAVWGQVIFHRRGETAPVAARRANRGLSISLSRAPTFSPIILSRASSDNVTSRLHGNERHRWRSWRPPADVEVANCIQGRILFYASICKTCTLHVAISILLIVNIWCNFCENDECVRCVLDIFEKNCNRQNNRIILNIT